MRLAVDSNRRQLKSAIDRLLEVGTTAELTAALKNNLDLWSDTSEASLKAQDKSQALLDAAVKESKGEAAELLRKIVELKDYFSEKHIWSFGGDGWAYDIGYGGVDHVVAS